MSDIIKQAKELRDNHRGSKFNPNYATINNIRKVAENFVNKISIDVNSITSINRVIQYMISAKIVGDRYFYNNLNEYTGNVLDSFCEDIEVEDNCYDGFDTAIERHVYRENQYVYEYLRSKQIRYLDAGLIKYRNCHDIFLPEYDAVVDISIWKALDEIQRIVNTANKDREDNDDTLDTYELKNIRNFVYYEGKLRCTGEDGDPVDINDTDIIQYIVDMSTEFKDIRESDFLIEGCGSGRGKVCTSRKISLDQLEEGDEVYIKDGLVYHNLEKSSYIIVGPFELINLKRYDDYNYMSLVYKFNDHNKNYVDLIRLRDLSCDTVPIQDWEEDHATDELKSGFVYLTTGRTIMTRIKVSGSTNSINLNFNDIIELVDNI